MGGGAEPTAGEASGRWRYEKAPEGGRGPEISVWTGYKEEKGTRARLILDQQQRRSILFQAARR